MFNRSTKEDFQIDVAEKVEPYRSIQNIAVRTLNGFGYELFRKDGGKCVLPKDGQPSFALQCARVLAGKDNQPLSQAISLANLMVLIQNTLVDPSDQDAVNRMIGQFDVTATDWVKTHINELFDRRSKMIEYARQVDQTDQVWLPIKNNLSCSETYDWVFVDECQDLSKAQIELVKKVCFVLFFITCA